MSKKFIYKSTFDILIKDKLYSRKITPNKSTGRKLRGVECINAVSKFKDKITHLFRR